jgi:hypothetical protein
MKESDWKVFTAIKDKAIEQYCTVALEETQDVISDHKKHVHERYFSYISYFKIVIRRWLYFLMGIVDQKHGYNLLLFAVRGLQTKRYWLNYQMNFVMKQILKSMVGKMPNK